jgi:hypothetical protein
VPSRSQSKSKPAASQAKSKPAAPQAKTKPAATRKPSGIGRFRRARSSGSSPRSARPSSIGRYTPPERKGRYTPPVPNKIRRSPKWFGFVVLGLLIGGVLVILLNYLGVLPNSVSSWYLIAGLVMIFGGFLLATRYR